MANGDESTAGIGSPVPMPSVAGPSVAERAGDAAGAIGNVAKAASIVPGPVGSVAKAVSAGADVAQNAANAAGSPSASAAPQSPSSTSDGEPQDGGSVSPQATGGSPDAPTMKDAAGAVGDAAGTVSKVAGAAKLIPGIGAAAAGVQAGADAVGKAAKAADQVLPDAPMPGGTGAGPDAAAQAKQMADTVGNVAKLASHVPGPVGAAAKVAGAAAPMAAKAADVAGKTGLGGGLGGKGGNGGKPKDDPLKSMAKDAAKKWLIAHALPILGTVMLVGFIIATPMALTQCSSSGNSNKSTERTEMAIPKIAQYQSDGNANGNNSSNGDNGGDANYSGEAQALNDATDKQAAVVEKCKKTPSPGPGLCAGWVEDVLEGLGIHRPDQSRANADHLYLDWCKSSNKDDLKVGMIIAVDAYIRNDGGKAYAGVTEDGKALSYHVGIYIGDGKVMDNIGRIRTSNLDDWIKEYGNYHPVRWGWYAGKDLSKS